MSKVKKPTSTTGGLKEFIEGWGTKK